MSTVTSFVDLNKLKARSRVPVSINECNTQQQINFTSFTTLPRINEVATESPSKKYFSYLDKIMPNSQMRSTLSINSVGSSGSSVSSDDYGYGSLNYDSDSGCSIGNSSDVEYMKSICQKLYSKQKSRSSLSQKILTILFDYEDTQENFRVQQGDSVQLQEICLDESDVDGKCKYIVRKCTDGQIGSIPIDYTIDLNELKRKVKYNMRKTNIKLTHL